MNSIDFLSGAPNIFIFHKVRNKTNFGGVLFMIYIIVMILISLAYILDYALNDTYTYESINCFNQTNDTERDILNEGDELNPYLEVLLLYIMIIFLCWLIGMMMNMVMDLMMNS